MINSPRAISILSVILLLISGCGYVAGGVVWVVVANQKSDDEGPPNTPPSVSITTPSGSNNDLFTFPFQVLDLQSDPVDVTLEYSTDGGMTFEQATQAEGAGSSGVTGLKTARVSLAYTFVWNSLIDLGSVNHPDVRIRITPTETFTDLGGDSVTTGSFSAQNAFVATVAGGVVGPSLNFPNGLVADPLSGVIYVSDTFNNRVLRYDPTSDTASVYVGTGEPGFNGDNILATDAKLNLPIDLALAPNGDLYVCDLLNSRIRVVTAAAGFIDTIAGGGGRTFPDIGDGSLAVTSVLAAPFGIALDPMGNVYVADTFHNRVRVVSTQPMPFTIAGVQIDPFEIETIAGTGSYVPGGANGDGGLARLAQIGLPQGLAIDSFGRVYVSQPDENRIRVINPDPTLTTIAGINIVGNGIATIVGNGLRGFGGDGGAPNFARLDEPLGLSLDAADNLYLADVGNGRIRVVNTSGAPLTIGSVTVSPDTIETISGSDVADPGTGDGAPASDANLIFPTRIRIDPDGNLLVSEGGGNRVRAINATAVTRTWGGVIIDPGDINSLSISLEEQGTAFSFPARIVIDGAGNMFFTDVTSPDFGGRKANRIYRLDAETGTVEVIAGTGGSGFAGDGGPPGSATFSFPVDLELDRDGNLFVADTQNHRIRVINNQDSPLLVANVVVLPGEIQTVVGAGVPGYAGDGAPPTFALLRSPVAVVLDSAGNIFIAEQDNHVIRAVNTQSDPIDVAGTSIEPGTVQTITGDGIAGFGGDGGAAPAARLNTPLGLALDPRGNLFIADSGNFRIRAINLGATTASMLGVSVPPGTIRTVAGAGIPGSSGDGGTALTARLSEVRDLAVTPDGNLLIADSLNHKMRIVNGGPLSITIGGVQIDPGFISTIVGSGQPGFNGDGLSNLVTTLNEPTGIGLQPSGNLFVADSSNGVVRLVNLTDDDVRLGPKLIEPRSVRSIAGDPGGLSNGLVVAPVSLAQDAVGNVIFSDTNAGNSHSHRIFRLDPRTRAMTVLGGNGIPAYLGDRDALSGASFNSPTGLALDLAGNLYIADRDNHVVRVVNMGTSPVTVNGVTNIEPGNIDTIAGNGCAGSPINDVDARSTCFHSPTDVEVGPLGDVFISDTQNHQIRRVDSTGFVTLVAGDPLGQRGNGVGQFDEPAGIHLHATGTLYVADSMNHRIVEVNPLTLVSGVIVGQQTSLGGFNGDRLPPRDILLDSPLGVATDPAGNLFIVDTLNHRVLVYNPQVTPLTVAGTLVGPGLVTKIAGTNSQDFNGDALPPAFTALSGPSGILIDPAGDIFVSDTGNRRVRRFAR
ncbi:MAG: hypothetical protein O7H41_05590 [Planctomycetota bacterium]|nr:hypothetical protein [Planctomycetota bacterium]